MAQGVIYAGLKAPLLLFVADLEPVFDQVDSIRYNELFEHGAAFHEVTVLFLRAEPHDIFHSRAVVPAPIEDDDLARSRWYDYSRARDMMRDSTDTEFAPWYIVRSDDKRRARLNCISHLLSLIRYKKVPREKVKLPDRSKKNAYDDETTLEGRRFVPEEY